MNGAHVAFEGRHRVCACEGGVYVLIVAAAGRRCETAQFGSSKGAKLIYELIDGLSLCLYPTAG